MRMNKLNILTDIWKSGKEGKLMQLVPWCLKSNCRMHVIVSEHNVTDIVITKGSLS